MLVLIGFIAVVASLLLWTFVQEAAYVVILFGRTRSTARS